MGGRDRILGVQAVGRDGCVVVRRTWQRIRDKWCRCGLSRVLWAWGVGLWFGVFCWSGLLEVSEDTETLRTILLEVVIRVY